VLIYAAVVYEEVIMKFDEWHCSYFLLFLEFSASNAQYCSHFWEDNLFL